MSDSRDRDARDKKAYSVSARSELPRTEPYGVGVSVSKDLIDSGFDRGKPIWVETVPGDALVRIHQGDTCRMITQTSWDRVIGDKVMWLRLVHPSQKG